MDPSETKEAKIEMNVFPGADFQATFVIRNEDHTLGNSLKYLLNQNPSVVFAAYSLPHPSTPVMHIRIQTNGEQTAVQALQQALSDLKKLTQALLKTYDSELSTFEKENSMV